MLQPNLTIKNRTVLITGAAGFIGAYLVQALLKAQDTINIVGIDSLNDYYDVAIKNYRVAEIEKTVQKHLG